MEFKIGDRVTLKPDMAKLHEAREDTVRSIAGFYSDVEGGVFLDDYIAGFRSWNVEDLLPAPKE